MKPSDPRVAERFEVYACGVELANGFGELIDADEQRSRFVAAMDEKQRRYGERYPLDEDFLAAMTRMPDACVWALGFDRLVMLASGAPRIDQVVWTPPRRTSNERRVVTTMRTPAELASRGLVSSEALPALEQVAARYAVALTPDVAALIDASDPNDPIARQYIPSADELATQPGENADPIGDHTHSPVKRYRAPLSGSRVVQAGACLCGVLPVPASAARWSGR